MTTADRLNSMQPDGWGPSDWQGLLYAIRYKRCTPFLGAGACAGVLPLGGDIAQRWADEYDYPFEDKTNLIRVARYIAIEHGPQTPKFRILDEFSGQGPPDFRDPNEPHRVVADLDLPIYVTTNYDNFMYQALLRDVPRPRRPRREVCKWHQARQRMRMMGGQVPDPSLGFSPTPDEPLVFHLHGNLDDIDSMVLTEDDYLDFLMYISEVQELIPSRVQEAFANSSLLFLGYSLEDMNFKVLLRRLANYMQRSEGARHVSVQLAPMRNVSTEEQIRRATKQREHLERHFNIQRVKIYWGTCQQFAAELRREWDEFNRRNPRAA